MKWWVRAHINIFFHMWNNMREINVYGSQNGQRSIHLMKCVKTLLLLLILKSAVNFIQLQCRMFGGDFLFSFWKWVWFLFIFIDHACINGWWCYYCWFLFFSLSLFWLPADIFVRNKKYNSICLVWFGLIGWMCGVSVKPFSQAF